MKTTRRTTELAIWGALAFAGGFLPARLDLYAVGVQGPALVLMLVNFALTLPGRAPVWLVAIGTWIGLPLTYLVARHEFNPRQLIALVPAFIGAAGGRVAGSLLDTAASKLIGPLPEGDRPWYARPLSTRFILAVLLVAIAMMGLKPLTVLFQGVRSGAGSWLALIWMIMSLIGWIGLTPLILTERPILVPRADEAAAGVRPVELLAHIVVVLALTAIHAFAVVAISSLLRIPLTSEFAAMAAIAFQTFLPLDALAYLTILALGFASDVERHRREAAQREAALKMETLDARLSALRARLNPHFLFNSLNAVVVLARTGKTEETTRVVEGLTSLLRYVLDERRQSVPLGEELDFARQYLAVQQTRFGDRLRFEVESDTRSAGVLVPQLLLQPSIENAVEHGVAKTLQGGSVSVRAAVEDDLLHVTVVDDGPGPLAATSKADEPRGIGLANTRERLVRLYGERARLTMTPASGTGGTRVEILIPLET